MRLGDLALPIAPGTGDGSGPEVHDRQHYRLVGWRSGVVGYRRFFSITSLAGLRQEDRAVFDANHAEIARWFREGLVDGIRIDHPDGLTDPSGYLAWLRELVGPDAWIVIERSWPSTRRWSRRCRSGAPPVMTYCGKWAGCSSTRSELPR